MYKVSQIFWSVKSSKPSLKVSEIDRESTELQSQHFVPCYTKNYFIATSFVHGTTQVPCQKRAQLLQEFLVVPLTEFQNTQFPNKSPLQHCKNIMSRPLNDRQIIGFGGLLTRPRKRPIVSMRFQAHLGILKIRSQMTEIPQFLQVTKFTVQVDAH